MKISVVVPCYNEEGNISLFYNEITKAFDKLMDDTELIFINDGSKDHTMEKLNQIYKVSGFDIKVISFSRNFGKEAALMAGLEKASGDYVGIIDADLQQLPKYLLDMLDILEKHPEYDAVAAYQDHRKESKVLTFFKDSFYNVINRMTEIELKQSASDFRLLRRCVVNAIIALPEKCRFSKGIFAWVGFETYYMPYTVEERVSGTSKWNFWKLFAYAVDGIIAFSVKPLLISSVVGIGLFMVAIIMMIYIVIKTLLFGDPVAGFPTLASLILMLSGVQLLSVGILGQYMAKNYIETKNRPVYVVKEVLEKE